ncbi:SDR family NAD(P)-dependent oxidoreductase [Sinimarinibacterium sp. NLF-5-8]|uniref:SDR family NAD(P)-dependent oxidoreductase n=1 Tax=Sinimarinibacterium sp. NLF-5-8 TaxID=2698684 RepID=UPI00137BF049|nr:SDR family NAD(P)-dependent oxidoreductase [Sinimarinibacterium sp. NLF-5-8]QHS10176.1 SDR family NAD(P)-dependent oxidoreductase [Sinimarinibacterium sp. NLF-5-8]
MNPSLHGKVALVTGASRGAGKGIATALGAHGATVYVTGRTLNEGDAPLPGTIGATAAAVTAAGGTGIAVACDHRNDAEVAALFERIDREQGHLDILVNNATFLHDELIHSGGFWEKSPDLVNILDVGLRSAYVASWHAAQRMVKRNNGLIVFTSSFGANCYMHGAAYGAQKAGVDKFARDMGVDFRPYNVAAVSIWMGMLQTDRTRRVMDSEPEKYAGFWDMAETPEFTGHIIAAIYNDPQRADKNGQVLIGAEAAQGYGLTDAGRSMPSHRPMLGGPPEPSPAIVV